MNLTAEEIRDLNFDSLRDAMPGWRAAAYVAWDRFGPGTTRQVAERSGMNLLTLRPRTSELVECGLVVLMGRTHAEKGAASEGIYRASTQEEWEAWKRERVGEAVVDGQQLLI